MGECASKGVWFGVMGLGLKSGVGVEKRKPGKRWLKGIRN